MILDVCDEWDGHPTPRILRENGYRGAVLGVQYTDAADEQRSIGDLKTTVPARHVFVLGDNRDRSRDSREFGAVPVGDVVGYVEYIYWPAESWSRFGVADDRLP